MTKQSSDPTSHNKPCTICHTPRSVLVRCQIDESGKWHFVCPGKCWTSVSGGEVDAKGYKDEFPFYRYGGMWKNRHEDGPLNAKKPKKKTKKSKPDDGANLEAGAEDRDEDAESTRGEESSQEDPSIDSRAATAQTDSRG